MSTATKTATIRRYVWDADSVTEFVLTPDPVWTDCWAVALDGKVLGRVRKYQGSISTKITGTRLSRSGTPRALWAAMGAESDRWDYDYNGRADAIRSICN